MSKPFSQDDAIEEMHQEIRDYRAALEAIIGQYEHHSSGLWCTRTAGGGIVYLTSQASKALDKALRALMAGQR